MSGPEGARTKQYRSLKKEVVPNAFLSGIETAKEILVLEKP